MGQKRVSFEVAKAIKEAGYPQGNTQGQYAQMTYYDNGLQREIKEGDYFGEFIILGIDVPTYLDVWLWLWQVKGIHIDIVSSKLGTQMDIWDSEQHNIMGDNTVFYNSPEDAIEAAIKYLVDNDLIK